MLLVLCDELSAIDLVLELLLHLLLELLKPLLLLLLQPEQIAL